MKGKLGKFGLIFLALALCLSITGAAFALWSENQYIVGTVETGYVATNMSAGDSWDSEIVGKDYSYIDCWVDPLDLGTLVVEVVNAYPSIDYYQDFDIHNTGTIPVRIQSITPGGTMPIDATVEVTGILVGDQLEPSKPVWGTLHVHLGNDAEQDTTYTFTVTFLCVQWNEYVAPG